VLLNLLTKGIDTNWGYKLKDDLAQPTAEVQFVYHQHAVNVDADARVL